MIPPDNSIDLEFDGVTFLLDKYWVGSKSLNRSDRTITFARANHHH